MARALKQTKKYIEQLSKTKDITIKGTAVKAVPLTNGQITIIDAEDYELISQYTWYVSKEGNKHYATAMVYCGNGKQKELRMHRLLLGLKSGDKRHGEHKNGNGLDNRRSVNLRIATSQQNHRNRKARKGCTSKYKGVCWDKKINKWKAQICLEGKNRHLGCFNDEIEAAKAYDKAAIRYFGEFARLNISNKTLTF